MGNADLLGDFPLENATGAASPPPPPPPPVRSSAAPRDAVEAIARVTVLADRLAGIERELVELQVFRRRVELGGSIGDARHGDALVIAPSGAADPAEVASLKAELERLRTQAGDLAVNARTQKDLETAREEASRAKADLEQLRAAGDMTALKQENDRLLRDVERIEGEYQSLKILHEERTRKSEQLAKSALDGLAGAKLDPKVEEKLRAIVGERDRLLEEKAKLEQDLGRIKGEATRKIKELKADVDKRAGETETMRLQKDNLMKQLMARDSGDVVREVTLEEITNSEVFKNMLGNIRRTSRMEVTHLHDAIAAMKDVDPKAYNMALDLVAKQFKKAAMENPLATLPRA